MIATLINQRHLVRCIQRLQQVDDKLAKESVQIDYDSLKQLSIILITVTLCRQLLMILFGSYIFDLNIFQLCGMYSPICVSVLSKIYFVLIVCNIRKKFDAINSYLDELAISLNSLNDINFHTKHPNEANIGIENNDVTMRNKSTTRLTTVQTTLQTDFLQREFVVKSKPNFFQIMTRSGGNLVKPFDSVNFIGNAQFMTDTHQFPFARSDQVAVGDRLDKRLTNLCFLHDEICEIVGKANYMFSFQMLMLMAYGFLGITAQLYFVYCSLASQVCNIF